MDIVTMLSLASHPVLGIYLPRHPHRITTGRITRSKYLMVIAFVLRCSLLSSRLAALLLHVILNESLQLFIACFEYPHEWRAYSAVWLLHGRCHVKLLPSRRVLCTSYNHAPCHIISCKATYVFNCNLPPALLAEWPGSFTCYCRETGVERILK